MEGQVVDWLVSQAKLEKKVTNFAELMNNP
jgi:hypothetical protein